MPKNITEVTRRKIMDTLQFWDYSWSGKLEEPAFLARIFDLSKMPSTDHRYKDAYGDITQHRVNNADWDDNWPFIDSRFNLLHGSDATLLRFLEEMLHPLVRDSDEAAAMAEVLNKLLRRDGFELVPEDEISGYPVYKFTSADRPAAQAATPTVTGIVGTSSRVTASLTQPSKPNAPAVNTPGGVPAAAVAPSGPAPGSKQIFIVHGHDSAAKNDVHLFLYRLTGKDALIMHEQGNKGQSLMAKLETAAAMASYAVVLLTADDLGKAKSDADLSTRGRQNVVFEMGYFMGKLGVDKVAVLYEDGVELPGDVRGMLYIPYDAAFGGWKGKLAGEIKDAGHDVDLAVLTK